MARAVLEELGFHQEEVDSEMTLSGVVGIMVLAGAMVETITEAGVSFPVGVVVTADMEKAITKGEGEVAVLVLVQ